VNGFGGAGRKKNEILISPHAARLGPSQAEKIGAGKPRGNFTSINTVPALIYWTPELGLVVVYGC
jgi:hypothetical protein